jgi:hypothetical protein
MLKLLLDEHISPAVADGLRRRQKNIDVTSLVEWEGGRVVGVPDETLLTAAAAGDLTLVTYDRRTIPPLLMAWAEAEQNHCGIIFVDEKTIRPSDIGGLIAALRQLNRNAAGWDWKNRVCFLRR